MNAKNFGLVMTSPLSIRPSVRNPTMLMRPCLFLFKHILLPKFALREKKTHREFVWREVVWKDSLWQDAFTTEMLKNKKHKDNLYVFVGYVDKRGKKRKRKKEDKKAEMIKQSSTWKRATDGELEQADRKRKVSLSLKKPHICLYHPFVMSYGNF